MAFIITDNKGRYIGNNKKIVNSEKDAYRWSCEIKALNCLKNNLPLSARCFDFIVKDTTVSEDIEVVEVNNSSLEDIDKFADYLSSLYKTTVNKDRVKFLSDSIQKLDLKVVDIQHAIEFNKVNVVGGYNYYKLLHDVLVERRKYKDELQKINIIRGTLSEVMANNLIKSLEGANNKQYQPRVLKELFE